MKLTKYECDGCGVVHGHKTEMQEIPIRFKSGKWLEAKEHTMHLCVDCATEPLKDVSHVLANRPKGEVEGVIAGSIVLLEEELNHENFEEDLRYHKIMKDVEDCL